MPLATLTGHAVGGVAGAAEQRRRRSSAAAAVGGAGQLVVLLAGLHRLRHPVGPHGDRGARRPHPDRQPGSRAPTAAAARSTCGSGSPNGSARPAAPRTSPGAPWLVYYARALGNKVGKGVDLHSSPPVTGMLTLGHRCSIEPEVDLTGHWIDGDLFHVGPITVGNDATVGARTTLLPGAVDRQERRRRTGLRRGRQGQGRPVLEGLARDEVRQGPPPVARRAAAAARRSGWRCSASRRSCSARVPLVALGAGLAVLGWAIRDTAVADATRSCPPLAWTPVATARRGGGLRRC